MKQKSFARGYSMILHSFLMWLFFIAAASTGLNILIPGFAAKNSLEATQLLSVNTIAALIAVFASIVINRIAMKKGVKIVTIVSLLLGGIVGAMGLSVATGIVTFTICCIAAQVACNGYANSITNNLITNWFPRTRGRILGITTCGVPAAVLLVIPRLGKMMAMGSFNKAVLILGGAMVAVGIISIFWLKNTPEECGLYPDNKPFTEEEKQNQLYAQQSRKEWSWKMILMNKQAWLIILAFGLFYIACTGFSAQMVPYLMEHGYDAIAAQGIMGKTSLFGLAGSIVSGLIDSKFGTKVSCIIYAVLTTLGFVLLFASQTSMVTVWACLLLQCTTMGAIANLLPSMIMQCFGRDSFISVNRIIFPGVFLIRSFCYSMVAWGVNHLGGYTRTYMMFGVMCVIATVIMFMINTKVVQKPAEE